MTGSLFLKVCCQTAANSRRDKSEGLKGCKASSSMQNIDMVLIIS